jgi:hypothetical protein
MIIDKENRICVDSPPYEIGPPAGKMWTIYPDVYTYDKETAFLELKNMSYEQMFDNALQDKEQRDE